MWRLRNTLTAATGVTEGGGYAGRAASSAVRVTPVAGDSMSETLGDRAVGALERAGD
jgi:hypothetical protein